jgi:hypothetical protein
MGTIDDPAAAKGVRRHMSSHTGSKVLIVGAGDAGTKMARGLAQSGAVRELLLADLPSGRGAEAAGILSSCHDCRVRFAALDGTRQDEVEKLLRAETPDLIVQSASLLSPWLVIGRSDPAARALGRAGLGLQLPAQLPVLTSVMEAVKAVDYRGPVANLSFPDATHPVLDRLGLAPAIGLGNVSMQHLRVRAALRDRTPGGTGDDAGEHPLIRLVGHHKQVYGVLTAEPPENPELRTRVYLGEEGARADHLAYAGYPIPPGIAYNEITAAAALPVLLALLPGAAPLRFSAPAPMGLPGGYPVRFSSGGVALDLPPGAELSDAVAFHWRVGQGDGIERVGEDGTVYFTEAARQAAAEVNPKLGEPLSPGDAMARFRLLARCLKL